jgi:hypothetical protein
VLGTGTYAFNLQVSDLVGGTYTTSATITWPPALAAGSIHVPVSGYAAQFFDNDSRYIRVNYVIGATSSIIVGSFLGKAGVVMGLGVDVGDIYTAV